MAFVAVSAYLEPCLGQSLLEVLRKPSDSKSGSRSGTESDSKVAQDPCRDVENSEAVYRKGRGSNDFLGCKLISVEDGSVYEALGFKVGEIIAPPKELKSYSRMKSSVDRAPAQSVEDESER